MASFTTATIQQIEDFPEAGVVRLVLKPEAIPDYKAGQYMLLHVTGQLPRAFSIGSAPGSQTLEFHIRQTGPGHYTRALREGQPVGLDGPYGDMAYIPGDRRPLIAVAGGTGIGAMKAVVEAALRDEQGPEDVRLYWGAQTRAALYMHYDFVAMWERQQKFTYRPALSHESLEGFSHGLVGDVLARDMPDLSLWRMYGAGPQAMLHHLSGIARDRGLDPNALHTDMHVLDNRNE